jgi:hypothetical protein
MAESGVNLDPAGWNSLALRTLPFAGETSRPGLPVGDGRKYKGARYDVSAFDRSAIALVRGLLNLHGPERGQCDLDHGLVRLASGERLHGKIRGQQGLHPGRG